MKIFITGSKQTGKSTCIQQVISTLNLSCSGYLTLPYYKAGHRVGFMLHSLVPLQRNDLSFSIDKEGIPGVFNDFGVEILEHSNQGVLVLDEIGFLERNEKQYLEVLLNKIKTYPNILGALRKTDLPYIQEIKAMQDVLVYDLDTMNRRDVFMDILKRIM